MRTSCLVAVVAALLIAPPGAAIAGGRSAVADAPYSVKATDTYVGVTTLTAPRTITLPPASQFPAGQPLVIADESGNCSADAPIIVAATSSDTIAGETSMSMQASYQRAVLYSNGANLWVR